MASGSTSFGLYTNLRGVEKQPFSFSRVGVVGAFYGFDSVRRFGISHKGRYTFLSLMVWFCLYTNLVNLPN